MCFSTIDQENSFEFSSFLGVYCVRADPFDQTSILIVYFNTRGQTIFKQDSNIQTNYIQTIFEQYSNEAIVLVKRNTNEAIVFVKIYSNEAIVLVQIKANHTIDHCSGHFINGNNN